MFLDSPLMLKRVEDPTLVALRLLQGAKPEDLWAGEPTCDNSQPSATSPPPQHGSRSRSCFSHESLWSVTPHPAAEPQLRLLQPNFYPP